MRLLATLKQKLFRWQSDGSAPVRLGQRRIFILPTRAGLLFAGVLLAMLSGAINYSLALGHALVFLLAGLGLVGMVHCFRNLHDLVITPGRSSPVFAGETAHFELLLSNERPTPRLALGLGANGQAPLATWLEADSRRSIAVPLATTRRGWCDLPRLRLATRYPLGLFEAWSYLQPAMRCLVYPAPLLSPLPDTAAGDARGSRQGNSGEDDFAGFRTRQPADALPHVAWKASARQAPTAPLLVKQFTGASASSLHFAWAQTANGRDTETRLALLCGWVLQADQQGLTYSLDLPGQHLPAASGPGQRAECLRQLALFQA